MMFLVLQNTKKATCGFSHKLILTRNNKNAVLNKAGATADAIPNIDNIHWYLAQYTPSIPQQDMLRK